MKSGKSLDGPTGVPPGLREWIREYGRWPDEASASAERMEAAAMEGAAMEDAAMEAAAIRALEAALARQGGDREGAFALLAADALLTNLCEGAAEGSDPASRLEALVRRVSATGGL